MLCVITFIYRELYGSGFTTATATNLSITHTTLYNTMKPAWPPRRLDTALSGLGVHLLSSMRILTAQDVRKIVVLSERRKVDCCKWCPVVSVCPGVREILIRGSKTRRLFHVRNNSLRQIDAFHLRKAVVLQYNGLKMQVGFSHRQGSDAEVLESLNSA